MIASRESSVQEKLSTEVIEAIQCGALEGLIDLVEKENHSLNGVDPNNLSAVNLAAKHGHLSIVKWLCEKNQFSLAIDDISPYKDFLHYMLRLGHLEIIKWLVEENKFSLDEIDTERVVLSAIRNKHFSLLKWLVEEKHYALDAKHNNNRNVLAFSIEHGSFEITRWLTEEKKIALDFVIDGENALLLACRSGDLKTMQWLIDEKGFSLNVTDDANRGPVIYALQSKKLAAVKYLVEEKQCSLHVKSSTNGTHPIHYAVILKNLPILKWLIDDMKCDLTVTNKDNKNILELAYDSITRYDSSEEILTWLIQDKNLLADSYFRTSIKKIVIDFWSPLALYHLVILSVDENELKESFQLIDQSFIARADRTQSNIVLAKEVYEKALTAFKKSNHPFYNLLLDHYCEFIYPLAHVQYLFAEGNNARALDILYRRIHDSDLSIETTWKAQIALAERLLLGDDYDEANSPLSVPDPLLTDNNCLMKRAIQAYFLLKVTPGDELQERLKARIQNILLGKRTSTFLSKDKNWLPEAYVFYAAYKKFKKDGLKNKETLVDNPDKESQNMVKLG